MGSRPTTRGEQREVISPAGLRHRKVALALYKLAYIYCHIPITGEALMGTAVAANGSKKLLALLTHPEAKARIGPMLAPGDDYERVVAAVMKLSRTNPDLERCTGTSVLDAVATAVGWHLEIGETAHIIPYKGKAVPVMDYKGMAQLMIASRAVRWFDPWLVYSREKFAITAGSEPMIIHQPISRHAERGELTGVYINIDLPFGARAWRYMSIEDVDVIRQKYSKQWKDGPVPPWYAIKTLMRQIAKMIPKSPQLARAFAVIKQDEEIELGEIAEDAPRLGYGSPGDGSRRLAPPSVPPTEREPGEEQEEFQDDRDLAEQ
jgi:phage RecT family recombinase